MNQIGMIIQQRCRIVQKFIRSAKLQVQEDLASHSALRHESSGAGLYDGLTTIEGPGGNPLVLFPLSGFLPGSCCGASCPRTHICIRSWMCVPIHCAC